jgi:hypothetical protein
MAEAESGDEGDPNRQIDLGDDQEPIASLLQLDRMPTDVPASPQDLESVALDTAWHEAGSRSHVGGEQAEARDQETPPAHPAPPCPAISVHINVT